MSLRGPLCAHGVSGTPHGEVRNILSFSYHYNEGGVDIDIRLLFNLRRCVEEHCNAKLCTIERVGMLTHKHFKWYLRQF